MPRTVAVVGAGAAGLVAARQLLREGLDVAVFEKSGRAGGTWAYDPCADADPLSRDPGAPGAAHGSLYASLRTNLTRDLMSFSDFPMAGRVFAGDARAFPGHQEVLAFLDAFAEECGVAARVRLRSEVLRVAGAPLGQRERWAVSWRREDGEVAEEVFDAVVVCNGHCTVPRVPGIRGACHLLVSLFCFSSNTMEFRGARHPMLVSQELTIGAGSRFTATIIAPLNRFGIRYFFPVPIRFQHSKRFLISYVVPHSLDFTL